jgi:hypothetical protein
MSTIHLDRLGDLMHDNPCLNTLSVMQRRDYNHIWFIEYDYYDKI